MRKTLPKKWCVKNLGTKEFKCLIDYANSKGALPPYFLNNDSYFHFPNRDYTTSGKVEKGFTEIINREAIVSKQIVSQGAYTLLMALKNTEEE